jgi:hypothetical protein
LNPDVTSKTQTRIITLGVFIASLAILFTEIIVTRILGISLGSHLVYHTVSIAMLGLGCAAAVVAIGRKKLEPAALWRRVGWLLILGCAGAILLFVSATVFRDFLNTKLDQLPMGSNPYFIGHFTNVEIQFESWGIVILGVTMAVPYFFYGAALTTIFKYTNEKSVGDLYAADLIGACTGALLAVLLLEAGGYKVPFLFAIGLPLIASVCFFRLSVPHRTAYHLAGIAVFLGLCGGFGLDRLLEPKPHLPMLSRLTSGYEPTEVWYDWTSYGRIGAIELQKADGTKEFIMAHGKGEGHAPVVPWTGSPNLPSRALHVEHSAMLAMKASSAKKILVLLAGAGADMVILDRLTEGKSDITGVELIKEVFDWPARQESFKLKEFFARPNIHMVAAEAREFLSRDANRYDSILVSWAGAVSSYTAGIAAASPAYLYTTQGLEVLKDHLTPQGQLTIMAGSKVRLLGSLIELDQKQPSQIPLTRQVVIVGRKGRTSSTSIATNYSTGYDRTLLYKPAGFSQEDVKRIEDYANLRASSLLYAPFRSEDDPNNIYTQLLQNKTLGPRLEQLADKHRVDLNPNSDDHPFVFDMFAAKNYLSKDFWTEQHTYQWQLKRTHLVMLGIFFLLSVLIIVGPLLFTSRIPASWSNLNQLIFFGLLGFGFMFVEIGILYKLRVIVGHPGHTIAVVLSSLVLFSGLGSKFSKRLFESGWLSFRKTALILFGVLALTLFFIETGQTWLCSLPKAFKFVSVFIIPGPAAFLMGQLFPRGLGALLAKKQSQLVAWAWAINATTSTIAAGLGILLAQVIGFRLVVALGMVCYLLVAAIPHSVRTLASEE